MALPPSYPSIRHDRHDDGSVCQATNPIYCLEAPPGDNGVGPDAGAP
jgi:hypothetical protein